MKIVLIYLLVVLAGFSLQAQTNLVANPGFEQYSECPNGPTDFGKLSKWFKSTGSPNYYNTCSNSIPNNFNGQQEAFEGNGYSGIFTYVTPNLWFAPPPPGNLTVYYFWDVPEFFGTKLKYNLTAGKRYNCGFYVSLGDSCYYATKNMGMLFSSDSIYEPNPPTDNEIYLFNSYIIDSLDPQVRYTGNEFLNDRIGWTKIEGSFIADGTEQYLYIGDFDHNPLNDTLNVFDSTYHHFNPEFNWNYSYYYIDNVWVYEDSTTSVEETPAYSISIYPNPATEVLNIKYNQPIKDVTFINIYDATGKFLFSKTINDLMNIIDISNYNSGFYMYRIVENNQIRYNGKFTIVR